MVSVLDSRPARGRSQGSTGAVGSVERAIAGPPKSGASLTGSSASRRDYLRAVWVVREHHSESVCIKDISDVLGVCAATTSEMVRKLAAGGYLCHPPYGSITLTLTGEEVALRAVRRHRLLKTYLHRELGYRWGEIESEATRLAPAVSEMLVNRIDAKLGFPHRDPNGDRIPWLDGLGPVIPDGGRPLHRVGDGSRCRVVRVAHLDPEVLGYLESIGLLPDTELTMCRARPAAGIVEVCSAGSGTTGLGLDVAASVWVADLGE